MIKTLLSVLMLVGSVLFAGPAPHVVDQAHSQINFVADARFISCHGHFDKWQAEVNLDPTRIETSSVRITIDAASINTRIDRRDNHLRSKDFFWVEQHPTITFTSTGITKTGTRTYNVTGDLTLRGVTKQITIPVEHVFYENNRGRFKGTFQINRKEFGISFDSPMNSIADLVTVQFDVNVLDKAATERPRKPAA
jgi:polyisoprenoid-binding protein YceI